ncbi:hypothetical protein [uncultured Thalassolituus sp.]|uniref:hypothetical protein n=1 Tax=Thalassolituus sp. TaxID=2030822 RepID=UPI00261B678F|nr:hypothetical protein [uncultured Thalassolituus sp.]
MSAIGLVLVIAIPLSLLMLGAVLYSRKVQKQQLSALQARTVRQKADEYLEALEYLILVDDHKDIQRLVLDRIAELQAKADSMISGAARKNLEPFDAQPYNQRIDAAGAPRKVLKSDRELRYGRRQFSMILRMLPTLVKKKVISESAMVEYRRYLKMTLLEREVDTYTAQGDVAAKRGDVVTAANYYKAARKLLIEFDMQFPEKNERVRRIAEKTAALYRGEGGEEEESNDALSKALSKEEAANTNEFGMSSDPSAQKKRF